MKKNLKRFDVEWSILSEEKDKEWPQRMVVHAKDPDQAKEIIASKIIEGNKYQITNVTPL
ncbi:MAG: hypothetical protein PF694_09095 [Bacteroidetes bacterium]|jgi:hypothetical protein|nr:hypothetical protein [Bacteroidota bacterium]